MTTSSGLVLIPIVCRKVTVIILLFESKIISNLFVDFRSVIATFADHLVINVTKRELIRLHSNVSINFEYISNMGSICLKLFMFLL